MKLKLPKFILEFSGHLYFHKYPMFIVYRPDIHKVRGKAVRQILDIVKPGDILLRRFDQYLNTLCTPGFWSHAGIYVGGNDMVHSVSQGCIREDILNFCRADAVCVLEPTISNPEAIERAKLMCQMNVPYDYDFESFNDTYYCTELVDFVYEHIFKDDFTTVAGNKLLTPDSVFGSNKIFCKLKINYKS